MRNPVAFAVDIIALTVSGVGALYALAGAAAGSETMLGYGVVMVLMGIVAFFGSGIAQYR